MPSVTLSNEALAALAYVLTVEINRLERLILKGRKDAGYRIQLQRLNEALARIREAMTE